MVCIGVNWDFCDINILGLNGFFGNVIYSKDYRIWKNYKGKCVLVVGLGNFGGLLEIFLC